MYDDIFAALCCELNGQVHISSLPIFVQTKELLLVQTNIMFLPSINVAVGWYRQLFKILDMRLFVAVVCHIYINETLVLFQFGLDRYFTHYFEIIRKSH